MLCNYKGGGLENCYITLYDEEGVLKSTFLRYIIYGRPLSETLQ